MRSNLSLSGLISAVEAAAKQRRKAARSKKKEVVDLTEEILEVQPKESKAGNKKQIDFMDKIMGTGEDDEHDDKPSVKRLKVQEEECEDDGFEEWREGIINKAVEMGFTKYKQFLRC